MLLMLACISPLMISAAAMGQSYHDIDSLALIGVDNPYPEQYYRFIGSNGYLRILDDVKIDRKTYLDPSAVAGISVLPGKTLDIEFGSIGLNSTLNLGSSSDIGLINVNGYNGTGGTGFKLNINGGTVTIMPPVGVPSGPVVQPFGLILSTTQLSIDNNATLYLGSYDTSIRSLSGNGQIGIAGSKLTISGGTFSTGITGASRLIFSGTQDESVWSGVGQSIGTLEVRSGARLTTTNPTAVESTTGLQIDGTYNLGSSLVVDAFNGNGHVVMADGERLTVGSQGADATFGGVLSGNGSMLQKEGSGTLSLSGSNVYTGGTVVNGGSVLAGSANAFGTGQVSFAGGTKLMAGANDLALANTLFVSGTTIIDSGAFRFRLNGSVSGSGSITKVGTGTLTLAATNSFTGGLNLSAGTVALSGAGTLGSATGTSGITGGTLDLGATSQTQASLVQSGGTVQNGTISVGTYRLTNGTLASDSTVSASTLFDLRAGTVNGVLAGAGAMTKTTAGSATLAGSNTYTGGTTIVAGTLIAASATAFGPGSVSISGGATLQAGATDLALLNAVALTGSATIDTLANRLTLGGVVSGAGPLTKTGAGTLALTGISTYTGATTINAGALIVNGSIAPSSGVTVGAGASLGGSGTVSSTTVTGGTLSPGNSPGTLTINGNLTMDAGSTYKAEVQGSIADRINVTGTASLAGTLRLLSLGGAYSFNSPYTLLSATGGRSGTFGTVDQTGTFGDGVAALVSYTGQDVQLTLTPKPLTPIVTPGGSSNGSTDPQGPSSPGQSNPAVSPAMIGGPSNGLAIATAIDAAVAGGANASPLFNLYNLPAAAIPAAVNQLSGEAHTSTPAIANSFAGQFLGTMLDLGLAGRLSIGGAGPGTAAFSSRISKGYDQPEKPALLDHPLFAVWGASFGSAGRTDGSARIGSTGRDVDDAHRAVGADLRIGSSTIAGIAFSGGKARASLSGGLGKVESDVFQAGLYGMTRLGPVNLAAAGSYGRLDNDVSRAVPVLGNSLVSSYASTAWSGRIQASTGLAGFGGFTVSPLAALQAVSVRNPAFSERTSFGANAAALNVARGSDTASRSELGAQLDGPMMVGGIPLTAFVRASWVHYFQRDAQITASLASLPGTSFVTQGARPDANAALIAAGLDAKLNERVMLGIRLDSELSANTKRLGATAQIRVSF